MRSLIITFASTAIPTVKTSPAIPGKVKGFAVTLGIGIVVSMITAILGTHGMFDYFMQRIEKSNNTRFWFGYRRK